MGQNLSTIAFAGLVAASLFALVVALWMRRRSRRARPPLTDDLAAFTRELFAAQTTPDLNAVIARHLPSLVGTTRAWISAHTSGRRHLIVPSESTDTMELLGGNFEEWTTLPLRAGNEVVGLIGVDSASARARRVREVLEAIAPLIGQALYNAQTVDVLREASLMDALTGTATRREGLARLHAELKRAQRTGTSMAVMLLDLDRFKSINDRSGHAMGDAVLTAVGQTLRRTLRASDIRCRWGGEEFLVAVPDADLARAQVVAQGLLKNVAAATVPTPDGPIGTTTSIGLTMTVRGETDVEAIINRADVALYRAKHAGRGCVEVVLADTEPPRPAAGGNGTGSVPPGEAGDGGERTLPFPDRRNPNRRDRRRVPGPGRRATDHG